MGIETDVAIRLADEGVPVRAIARAVHVNAEELRPHFEHAKLTGRLVDLPREDWPPGIPRAHRVPDLQPIADINDDVLKAAIMLAFGLTINQASMFLALIRRREMHRDQLHELYNMRGKELADTDVKIVDVQICKIRQRLEGLGIEIRTLWGFGYFMTIANRRLALELLLTSLGRPSSEFVNELEKAPAP
jgi:hypothetical protein